MSGQGRKRAEPWLSEEVLYAYQTWAELKQVGTESPHSEVWRQWCQRRQELWDEYCDRRDGLEEGESKRIRTSREVRLEIVRAAPLPAAPGVPATDTGTAGEESESKKKDEANPGQDGPVLH